MDTKKDPRDPDLSEQELLVLKAIEAGYDHLLEGEAVEEILQTLLAKGLIGRLDRVPEFL